MDAGGLSEDECLKTKQGWLHDLEHGSRGVKAFEEYVKAGCN